MESILYQEVMIKVLKYGILKVDKKLNQIKIKIKKKKYISNLWRIMKYYTINKTKCTYKN